MKEFTLKRNEVKTLKLNIDKKVYEIPLSGSLPYKVVKSLDTYESTVKFLKKYIPEKIVDELTQDEYSAIVNAWGEASKEDAGLSLGE